jgi:uncharacterized protein (DUF2062 family)
MNAGTQPPAATWQERVARRLAALGDSPERTAAAFALGVFLSFSPFLGLQIAAGMTAAVLFRLSKVAVFIGLNANLPWIVIPWYVLTTAAAAAALGLPGPTDMDERLASVMAEPVYRAAFWHRFVDALSPYLWSFLVGPTAGAAVLGLVSYFATVRGLTRYRPSSSA